MGQRAAIYTRISKDSEGKALGVARQEKDCRELAERLGYDSVEVFEDNDVSASTLSTKLRPRFKEMMDRARRGEFSAIIAYSNSRLTRRIVELQALIDVTRTTGTRIHTVASGQHDLDTADGRAAMMTIAVWDQAEAERVAERVKRASVQRQTDGHWHGGIPPFGYRQKDKALVIDDTEAKIVREAVRRLVDEREPLYSIVKDWNTGPKYTTRKGKHWRHANLRALMTNRALIGENKAGVPAWEPIIEDRDTFDLLQRILVDPARKIVHSPGMKGGKYAMGGGLTRCGRCDGPLTSSARKQADGSMEVKLKCSWLNNKKDPVNHPMVEKVVIVKGVPTTQMHDTGRVSILHDDLEAYVWGRVIDELSKRKQFAKSMKSRQERKTDPRIAEVGAEIRDLESRRARVQEMGEAGAYTPAESAKRVRELNVALANAKDRESQLLDVPNLSAMGITPGERVHWRDMAPMQRRNLLRALIEKVVVNEWPKGLPSMSLPRKGETPETYAKRVEDLKREGMEKRVQIVWR